jgi:uncharacterized protein YjaG (DUF416 family)
MAFLRFDATKLIAELANLPRELRVAFAASCAERLLPNYERFAQKTGSGKTKVLKGALDSVWEDLQGRVVSDIEFASALEKCLSLIPSEEDDPGEYAACAESAAASVAFAIRTRLTGAPQEAVWAAQRAYEAVDHLVMRQFPTGLVGRDFESAAVSHPLVQAELRRQQTDLHDLQSISTDNHVLTKDISSLRERARRDASVFG